MTASLAAYEGKDCDALESPRPARRALAAFPWSTLSFATFAQCPVHRATDEQHALACLRPAGAALPVPREGAPCVALRADRPRCAAFAARVIAACAVLSRARLCAPQDRLRRHLRASPPSWALSTPSLRAPQAHVRFVRFGRRGKKRGREARVMGRTCDPRRISRLYGIVCSSRGTHGGSSASYVRSICFVVHAVQKIVCAEPIGHLHFHH